MFYWEKKWLVHVNTSKISLLSFNRDREISFLLLHFDIIFSLIHTIFKNLKASLIAIHCLKSRLSLVLSPIPSIPSFFLSLSLSVTPLRNSGSLALLGVIRLKILWIYTNIIFRYMMTKKILFDQQYLHTSPRT